MSEYQNINDEAIAKNLIKLGKTPDCVCDVETYVVADRLDVHLDYSIKCRVHFPLTSTLLGQRQ